MLLAVVIGVIVVQRPSRRRVANAAREAEEKAVAEKGAGEKALSELPVSAWTARIVDLQRKGEWAQLDDELDALSRNRSAEYRRLDLQYLHGRAAIENGDDDSARKHLSAFLQPSHPYRDRALFHLASVEEDDGNAERAMELREELIFEHRDSIYRREAIEDALRVLAEKNDAAASRTFAKRLFASADSALRRELDALLVAVDLAESRVDDALARGERLLKGSVADDPADRAARALDRPEIVARMSPAQLLLVAQAAKDHRHYGRAVELLRAARTKAPQRSDELTFEIGRAWFGAENFAEAERTYLAGANGAKDLRQKSTFFWHAARAVQLRGNDRLAEELMTAAIAVKGKFPSTSAALSQRLRTRLMQKRWKEASSDLQQIVRLFPQEHVRVETAVASAIANLAAGRLAQADRDLGSIPATLTDDYDESEIEYWKGRVAEERKDAGAVDHYLTVLRSSRPTHFAYFARARVQQPSFRPLLERELAARRAAVEKARGEKAWDRAREAQTDIVLLHPAQEELEKLRALYREVPAYRRLLELKPAAMPAFGDSAVAKDPGARLLAMGLFDDALAEIERRFPIGKAESTLTQSLALNRAGASRESILLVEIAMKSVPSDYLPELLPRTMLALLYPRYFFDIIQSDADRYDADAVLVLSIMREESRFNPRAKSVAAARGLLQFIITTARDVGRSLGIVDLDAQDLYDPRVIIQLGAKYIGDLLDQFGGNPYRAAAAYNAGPVQTRLWNRITPSSADDFFLSTVNFDETKHYVRKVMNSYRRYGSLYGSAPPSGGMRPEP